MSGDPDSHKFTQRAADSTGEIQQMMRRFRAKPCKAAELEAFVALCSMGSPMGLIADVTDVFCKYLDGPAFDPSKGLDPSLEKRRQIAFISLGGIGVLGTSHSTSLSQFKLEAQPVIRRNWPRILNWILYFGFEATDAGLLTNKRDVSQSISVLGRVLTVVYRDDNELFQEALLKDKGLFKMILKLWWKTNRNEDTAPSLPVALFSLVSSSVEYLVPQPRHEVFPTSTASSTQMALQETVLHVANDDAPGVASRIVGYITNPAHQDKEKHQYACLAFSFIHNITSAGANSKLMNAFFQKKIGLHALRELQLLLLDADRREPILSESMRKTVVLTCFRLIMQSIMAPGALHWTTVLLENGLLHCIGNLARSAYFEDDDPGRDLLTTTFVHFLPTLLVHRGFVQSIIKAVKEAVKDGSAKRIESSFLGEFYKAFSRLVLERAVFNAIYERSSSGHPFEHRSCANCGSFEEFLATGLSKCAGCLVAVYCSRDCQREAWKKGHRYECDSLKGTKQSAGQVLKYGTNTFLEHLAIIEVRRHAKAVKSAINQDALLKNEPRNGIIIIVNYSTNPPQIKPSHLEAEMKELNQESRRSYEKLHDKLSSDQMLMCVISGRGGPDCLQEVHIMPGNTLNGPTEDGEEIILTESEASSVSEWSRVAAQSFDGKNLEFELDEVDFCLLDAHRNYQPGSSWTVSSKKLTVFDYLEEKIKGEELPFDLQ
ncbi:hypothetical protein SCHPADRAFT_999127 [Schizopora paradoxa]|uniref:MYND-type domain-containing protein n=1 Tax=Schizopora paradoxa TaxID=27342 RepID=A0A0H2RGY6_9AGAM|nr:hypothetical protein SCHPADRAFT_999127 [Schizopora paradoxa]